MGTDVKKTRFISIFLFSLTAALLLSACRGPEEAGNPPCRHGFIAGASNAGGFCTAGGIADACASNHYRAKCRRHL